MALFIIRAEEAIGYSYAPVAVEADTMMEAMKRFEEERYPGIFTDPSFGIGGVKIECVSSFIQMGEGRTYTELHGE